MAHRIKFGVTLPQFGASWAEAKEIAMLAEEMGIDSVWAADHFLGLDGDDPLEAWTEMSAVAAITQRVEIGFLVLCNNYRSPALLAKMADTVEEISGGRLILGLGSGYHKHEFDAFGFPFGYKVSRFEEAIQIVHGLLRNGEIDFEGKFHFARECELKPRGPRPEGPPILMGTVQPRMMACMAKYADQWNAYYDDTHNKVDGIRRLRPKIDAACRQEGRDPATLERTVTALVADASADPWWDKLPTENWIEEGPLVPLAGTPEKIAQTLLEYESEGISHLQICLEPTNCETIEAFARVLEAVDAASG